MVDNENGRGKFITLSSEKTIIKERHSDKATTEKMNVPKCQSVKVSRKFSNSQILIPRERLFLIENFERVTGDGGLRLGCSYGVPINIV